ncbi:hypothetical protein [Polyangium sp. 15x6]|uniref:hypothetical protein n=1 Tax=Polyangium sp. 15x6 TaxID=3042687 RepID=UPI00249B803A|nr:hypothetical protein [Polyangium sp. 15x6]MDI3287442.1 hypothetical protein [Polyangium sp. 15x6]
MISWWMRGAMALGLVLSAACGSTVNQDGSGGAGGGGGTGGGTGGSGGEGGVIPPECAVETPASDPGPYEVTFQFENNGAFPAFLREDCFLQYTIESCEYGYAAVSTHAMCTQPCSSTDDCLTCGACLMASVPVDVGAQSTDTWSGTRYTFGTSAKGCSCHEPHVARAGRYRIRVPVYASDMDAQAGTPSYEVTMNFELPAPNGVVVVPIGQSP